MAPEGPPFYSVMKRGGLKHGSKRAVIGHFQKARLVGKLGAWMSGMPADTG